MKAKEYAEKYKILGDPNCTDDEFTKNIKAMYFEMLDEMKSLVKARNMQSRPAFESLEKEFNIKGDAISRELGNRLVKGWFLKLWRNEI